MPDPGASGERSARTQRAVRCRAAGQKIGKPLGRFSEASGGGGDRRVLEELTGVGHGDLAPPAPPRQCRPSPEQAPWRPCHSCSPAQT